MAHTLTFNGDQVGSNMMSMDDVSYLLTSPVQRSGLFQQVAAVNADSRNLLYAYRFMVTVKAANPVLLAKAVGLIRTLQGQTGDLIGQADSNQVALDQWIIEQVQASAPAKGFGGRWLPDVTIIAIGNAPPRYAEV